MIIDVSALRSVKGFDKFIETFEEFLSSFCLHIVGEESKHLNQYIIALGLER